MVTCCNITEVAVGVYSVKFWRCIMPTLYFTLAGEEFVEYLCLFERIIYYLIIVNDGWNVSVLACVSESV